MDEQDYGAALKGSCRASTFICSLQPFSSRRHLKFVENLNVR